MKIIRKMIKFMKLKIPRFMRKAKTRITALALSAVVAATALCPKIVSAFDVTGLGWWEHNYVKPTWDESFINP